MKIWLLLTLLPCSSIFLHAQNLIPNSSFEIGECPSGHSVKISDFKVDSWVAADGGTPDYFHDCGKNDTGERLLNWAGGQYAQDGSAYVGIYLKKGRYQENIGIQLTRPLTAGDEYQGKFYISRAANAEYLPNEISIAFTQSPLKMGLAKNYDHRHIRIELKKPRELDTFSWERVNFKFTSAGGEQYLYIGSLHSNTRLSYLNPVRNEEEPMLNKAIYVYLDNISFSEVGSEIVSKIPSFELVKEIRPVLIYYEFNESSLVNSQAKRLDSLAQTILLFDYQLLITGSTDSIGTDSYNDELGLKRAIAVKQHLMFAGIPSDKIEIKTKGESTPNYPNHSEEYRSLNRNTLIEFFVEKNE